MSSHGAEMPTAPRGWTVTEGGYRGSDEQTARLWTVRGPRTRDSRWCKHGEILLWPSGRVEAFVYSPAAPNNRDMDVSDSLQAAMAWLVEHPLTEATWRAAL